jgi:hypothetical protein
MWDSKIRAEYDKHKGNGKDYYDFLIQTRAIMETQEPMIKELQQKYSTRPTRIIDQYNWMKTH